MPVTPNSIVTPQTPKSGQVSQSFTANTVLSVAPTNSVLLVTVGANGGRLTKLRAIPGGNVTATQLQVFRSRDGGTNKHLCNMQAAPAYTYATTTAPSATDFGYSDDNPMILEANERVYVAAAVAGPWSFEAEWADY